MFLSTFFNKRFVLILLVIALSLSTHSLSLSTAHAQSTPCAGTTAFPNDAFVGTGWDDWIMCDWVNDPGSSAIILGDDGEDEITIDVGVMVKDIWGDATSDPTGHFQMLPIFGRNDRIYVYGTVQDIVAGDGVELSGGDDLIEIHGTVGDVVGDYVYENGGNDLIFIYGTVNGTLLGDYAPTGGGQDVIVVEAGAVVKQSVNGDGGDTRDGGDDYIEIRGIVQSSVVGDSVESTGGQDTIIIYGTVMSVIGDLADTGGDDLIVIHGTVQQGIQADSTQHGGGNDTVELHDGASVGSTIDGGDNTPGDCDRLIFNFTGISDTEYRSLDDYANNPRDGQVTIQGKTYTWQNFECIINNSY